MGPIVGGWGLSQGLPLVGVFGIFCAPLLITALAANFVSPYRAVEDGGR